MPTRYSWFATCLFGLFFAAQSVLFPVVKAAEDTVKPQASKPNIVVILVDDMGWSDISCYGSEIPTPNIDRLAREGLRFSQFYNTGRCCPTRASLLTGQYSHRAGVGHMTDDAGSDFPAYRGYLNRDCVTLAEVLKPAGYFTAATGKWHVGNSDLSMWPLQRGFDRFYGVPEGGGFYFRVKQGRSIAKNNEKIYTSKQPPPAGWYTTDAWTENGLEFVDEALEKKQPFFLYVAHNAPHFPLQADPADIAKFRGRYQAGWDTLRAARHKRQLASGLIPPDLELSDRSDAVAAWESLTPDQQDRFDHLMAIYAAVMDRLDRSIGNLISGLEKRGVLENTLILFMSDNGGTAEGSPQGRLDGENPGDADSNVFYGESWANLSNTPFRRFKRENHEGGISTPLLVRWPGNVADPGGVRHQVCHVIDIMTTLTEVAGAEYPKEWQGRPIAPPAGVSLLPAFDNKPLANRPLFWEHEGNAAIREGDWKLVRLGAKSSWELYDLSKDRIEEHNLAKTHPARVNEMRDAWQQWAKSIGAIPKPKGK
ncbi:MAG: arylsulfatase [Planctomycetaceae bacterium]